MILFAILGRMWHITKVQKISVPREIGTLHHGGELPEGGSLILKRILN